MKLTLKIEGERFQPTTFDHRATQPYTVVDVENVEFTDSLTASFLRAVADEIDPPTPVESFDRDGANA